MPVCLLGLTEVQASEKAEGRCLDSLSIDREQERNVGYAQKIGSPGHGFSHRPVQQKAADRTATSMTLQDADL